MIFEMRFQILALAASLAASTLAGYALAVPPTASPVNPDRFAAVSDIFTEFGNELAWEDSCAPLPDNTGNGNGPLEKLVHRISQRGPEGLNGGSGKTACKAP